MVVPNKAISAARCALSAVNVGTSVCLRTSPQGMLTTASTWSVTNPRRAASSITPIARGQEISAVHSRSKRRVAPIWE
jgi:hypothetical protein